MAKSGKGKRLLGTEYGPLRSAPLFLLICGLILGMGAALVVFVQQKPAVRIKQSPPQQKKVQKLKPAPRKPVVTPPTKAVPSGPQPSLEIEGNSTFDFGQIWGKMSHTFTLKNTGNAQLEIKSIKPG